MDVTVGESITSEPCRDDVEPNWTGKPETIMKQEFQKEERRNEVKVETVGGSNSGTAEMELVKNECDLTADLVKVMEAKREKEEMTVTVKDVHSCPHCPTTLSCNIDLQRHLRLEHQVFINMELSDAGSLSRNVNKYQMNMSGIGVGKEMTGLMEGSFAMERETQDEPHLDHGSSAHSQTLELDQLSQKPFVCTICGKKFNYVHHLDFHNKTHIRDRARKCDVCGKRFKDPNDVKELLPTHTGEKVHKCEVCGKRFSHGNSLRAHKIAHSGETHKCEVCGKVFTRSQYLRKHELLSHVGEMAHKCEICGEGFSEVNSLIQHKLTHVGEKPHICDICGRGYSHLDSLRRHKLTHSGIKRHICEICGKTFSQGYQLKEHKVTHSTEKPHKCEICGIRFSRAGSLLRHIETHTMERPSRSTCRNCSHC